VQVFVTEDPSVEEELVPSRSASVTSSLDPYYFGMHSETDDPIPPLPNVTAYLSTTPDPSRVREPLTPASHPATIDRRGLVGVGELATPRWARHEKSSHYHEVSIAEAEAEGYDVILPELVEEDRPDSPWTIEAIDGELSEREDARFWLHFAILSIHLLVFLGSQYVTVVSSFAYKTLYRR